MTWFDPNLTQNWFRFDYVLTFFNTIWLGLTQIWLHFKLILTQIIISLTLNWLRFDSESTQIYSESTQIWLHFKLILTQICLLLFISTLIRLILTQRCETIFKIGNHLFFINLLMWAQFGRFFVHSGSTPCGSWKWTTIS